MSRSSVQSFTIPTTTQEIPAKQRCKTIRSKTGVEQIESTPRVAMTKSNLDQQKQTQYLVFPDIGHFLTFYSTRVKNNLPCYTAVAFIYMVRAGTGSQPTQSQQNLKWTLLSKLNKKLPN